MSPTLRAFLSVCLLLAATTAFAGVPFKKKSSTPTASSSLDDYLKSARQTSVSDPPPTGSLWQPNGRISELVSDYKARNLNDTIVIRVVEDTSAVSTGDVKTDRKFNTSSGVTGVAGYSGALPASAQSLLNLNSARTLAGTGSASTTSTIRSNLAGRIVEVLPNGSMVVEAVHDIDVNNQRQSLIVRGIVRPGDVLPDNSVLSSQVANLQLELKGKGVISDATAQPNAVVRFLLKLLNF